MQYSCIIYHRDDIHFRYADNIPYRYAKRYMVTVIDRDPDSAIPDSIALLPYCSFDRSYVADNLNHDVFILYY